MDRLHDDYDDRQLAVVVEYLSRAVDLGATHVAWLQGQPKLRRAEQVGRTADESPRRTAKAR
jgi:hypothetical protein